MENTLHCWKDKKVNCSLFFIKLGHLCLSAADWLAFLLQHNYFFIITNEHVWTRWHLAVNITWCKLGLKVKVKGEDSSHYSKNNSMFHFYFVHSEGTFVWTVFWDISLRMHVMLRITGFYSINATSLMGKQRSWPPSGLRRSGQAVGWQLNNRNKFA